MRRESGLAKQSSVTRARLEEREGERSWGRPVSRAWSRRRARPQAPSSSCTSGSTPRTKGSCGRPGPTWRPASPPGLAARVPRASLAMPPCSCIPRGTPRRFPSFRIRSSASLARMNARSPQRASFSPLLRPWTSPSSPSLPLPCPFPSRFPCGRSTGVCVLPLPRSPDALKRLPC